MILLDTNILSELMKVHPDTRMLQWMDSKTQEELFVSAITQAEIMLGIALLPAGRRKDALASAANAMFSEDFKGAILSFDQGAAGYYAGLVAHRTRIGRPISTEDAQIAAIALQHELLLATRNLKDFQEIEGIELIDPWRDS
ncbi:MAG: type II toxin-antitoxin system VapC family toxin [Methylococcales bacterium]